MIVHQILCLCLVSVCFSAPADSNISENEIPEKAPAKTNDESAYFQTTTAENKSPIVPDLISFEISTETPSTRASEIYPGQFAPEGKFPQFPEITTIGIPNNFKPEETTAVPFDSTANPRTEEITTGYPSQPPKQEVLKPDDTPIILIVPAGSGPGSEGDSEERQEEGPEEHQHGSAGENQQFSSEDSDMFNFDPSLFMEPGSNRPNDRPPTDILKAILLGGVPMSVNPENRPPLYRGMQEQGMDGIRRVQIQGPESFGNNQRPQMQGMGEIPGNPNTRRVHKVILSQRPGGYNPYFRGEVPEPYASSHEGGLPCSGGLVAIQVPADGIINNANLKVQNGPKEQQKKTEQEVSQQSVPEQGSVTPQTEEDKRTEDKETKPQEKKKMKTILVPRCLLEQFLSPPSVQYPPRPQTFGYASGPRGAVIRL